MPQVPLHPKIRQILAIRRASLGKRIQLRVPSQVAPKAIQLEYYRELKTFVRAMKELVNKAVTRQLSDFIGPDLNVRRDARKDINSELRKASDELFKTFNNDRLVSLARKYAQRTDDHNKRQVTRQFKQALSIDVFVAEPKLKPVVQAFTDENVKLIKSIPEKTLGQIRELVVDGGRAGRRHEDIAADIQERFGVSDSRAALIARDQISKLNGDLNRTRQSELGITSFIWRTVQDNRVRDEHTALEGLVFNWPEGHPTEGIPGDAINCRCSAEPDLSTILESA
jgi:SPP1 gp7 family putative phage head morphogenesis protein